MKRVSSQIDESRTAMSSERHPRFHERLIHDPIHGSIILPPEAWQVIDTPCFQRLRNIKQNGNVHYVYPGAEHSRFSHSIGVAYLAQLYGTKIRLLRPDLISEREIVLMCLAGLVHDLGHAAFSHLYDLEIIPMFEAQAQTETKAQAFMHEAFSFRLFQQIVKMHKVNLTELEVSFVGRLIFGAPEKVPDLPDRSALVDGYDLGRPFLYEVVSNESTGVDVDKFDYLLRDSHFLGLPCAFMPKTLIALMGIDSERHITYGPHGDVHIEAMWEARNSLHRRAYQHRVVKCIDAMTVSMLELCSNMETGHGPLCQAHHTLEGYMCLIDLNMYQIASQNALAYELLVRIWQRDLWPSLARVKSKVPLLMSFSDPYMKVSHAQFKMGPGQDTELEHVYYVFYSGDIETLDRARFTEELEACSGFVECKIY